MTVALANTPVLQTERLRLRAPAAGDYPLWETFAMSDRARFIGGPYNERMAWRAFGHVIGHWVMRGYGSFVFTANDDDTAIGMTGPWFPKPWPERELGWTVWSDAVEGTGLAFEAASATRDFAFGTLGWDTAVSYIDEPNVRSRRLAERLGAVLDTSATPPKIDDHPVPILVYRHRRPEVRA